MAHDQIVEILRTQIEPERAGRNKHLTDALVQEVEEAPEGAIRSGRMSIVLAEVAAADLEERAEEWLEISEGALDRGGYPWTPQAGDIIRKFLADELAQDLDQIVENLRDRLPHSDPYMPELEAALDRSTKRLRGAIELRVHAQDRRALSLLEKLGSPRYSAVLAAWEGVIEKSNDATATPAEVARSAVAAVEELARIVNGTPTKTLGAIVADLKGAGRIEAPLLKSFDEIWGWSSGQPGVRHGAGEVAQASSDYVYRLSEAALHLLLDIDVA